MEKLFDCSCVISRWNPTIRCWCILLEYHLPYSNHRIDVVLFGKNIQGENNAILVELKQWSKVKLGSSTDYNVSVLGDEHLHPSQQAQDYADHLREIQSAVETYDIHIHPCSYLHNYAIAKNPALRDRRFNQLLKESPLFAKKEELRLYEFLQTHVSNGGGTALMKNFVNGRFQASKKVLDVLEQIIHGTDKWALIGNQRIAFNKIWSELLRAKRKSRKPNNTAVLVRGGPGSGKTVIATQLLANAVRMGYAAAHSTGGKAFRTVLESEFRGADKLFIWNLHLRNAPEQGLDLLLVDEAHRIRRHSNLRFTPKDQRTGLSQVEELVRAAKVTVFLLDENQNIRPDEIGSSKLIREEMKRMKVSLIEFDLDIQFRCSGSKEYSDWVDYLLSFTNQKPINWNKQFQFSLVDSPHQLDEMLVAAKNSGETARLVAGFCWPWSDPRNDGSLVKDVSIGNWLKPWNAKVVRGRTYKAVDHPYTLWAETEIGESQVGCIYSAQGFEFDRVGVIWGEDLVWRGDEWVGQKNKTYDKPLTYKKTDITSLVRSAYRVLLTRGLKETLVYLSWMRKRGDIYPL